MSFPERLATIAAACVALVGCTAPHYPSVPDDAGPTGALDADVEGGAALGFDAGRRNPTDASVPSDAPSTSSPGDSAADTEAGLLGVVVTAPAVVASGTCIRVGARLETAGADPVRATPSVAGHGAFYAGDDCTGDALNEFMLDADGSEAVLYWKPALSEGEVIVQVMLTVTAPGRGGVAQVELRRAAREVATGGSFAAALLDDGTVWIWGAAEGTGQPNDSHPLFLNAAPTRVPGIQGPNVHSLVAGSGHACVLVGDSARCFGYYSRVGDSGADTSATPVVTVKGMGLGSGVTSISTLREHTCAVKAGAVYCWGGEEAYPQDPVLVPGLSTGVVEVSAGSTHDCARLQDGSVKCWGENSFGELGNGGDLPSSTPLVVPLGAGNVTSLRVGLFSSCVLMDGAVKCWGELGGKTPTTLAGLESGVSALAAGSRHYCAIMGGEARCWGRNDLGELGHGTLTAMGAPGSAVANIASTVSQIEPGNVRSTCALSNGLVYCWGSNVNGQLGVSGELALRTSPTLVPGMQGKLVSQMSYGSDPFTGSVATCTVGDDDAYCWGSNAGGALGLLSQSESASTIAPLKVQADLGGGLQDLGSVSQLATYNAGTCAIRGSDVVCWGGRPGASETTPTLLALPAGHTPQDVCLGESHGCVLLAGPSAGAYCWGSDDNGQLGDAANHATDLATPQRVETSSVPTAIACGISGSCAVVDGGVECWGVVAERAQLDTPAAISGLEPGQGAHATLVGLALATRVACTLTAEGDVWCWRGDDMPAIQALGGHAFDRIAGGGWSTFCARYAQGLWCWGSNIFQQADPGNTAESVVPAQIPNLVPPISEFATGVTSCAVDAQGLKCWGSNATRTFGGDASYFETAPVLVQAFQP